MRLRVSVYFLAIMGACTAQGRADTMYKCVDSAGKVAYASTPCQGKGSQAKVFSVAAPLDNAALAENERKRLKDLGRVKDGIAKRAAERTADDAPETYAYGSGAAMMPAAPKAKPVPSRVQRTPEEDERDLRNKSARNDCLRESRSHAHHRNC